MSGIVIKHQINLQNKIPEIVLEMWIGEFLFCLLCELIGIWFVKDKIGFTIGLACGGLLALASIYHMWWALDRSMDMDEKGAGKFVGSQYGIRYALIVFLVALLYVTKWGNAFAAFFSYLGMKMAAYIQPFIHRLIRR